MKLARVAGLSSAIVAQLFAILSSPTYATVIAVAQLDLENFTISGLTLPVSITPASSSGYTTVLLGATRIDNLATCPAPPGPCNPGNLTANPMQSTLGRGSFPGEDDFTQPPAGRFMGSRGDANVELVGPSPTALLFQSVAETRLSSRASTGGAFAETDVMEALTIDGGPGQSTQITFSFTGDPFVHVSVTADGDNNVAAIAMALRLIDGNGRRVFQYDAGDELFGRVGIASETTPFPLTTFFESSAPPDQFTYDRPPARFSVTTVSLSPGTYTLEMLAGAGGQAFVGEVPEPSTLLLVASVLVLAGALRSRRS